MKRLILTTCLCVLFVAGTAVAIPVQVESVDGPQDPLSLNGWVHELGGSLVPFHVDPGGEGLSSSWTLTDTTACFDDSDDPLIPNVEVTITNCCSFFNTPLYYVADPETTITNFDGFIGNAGLGDLEEAFKIDNVGINRPLISESLTPDNIFEPGEIWVFIIQDYGNVLGGPPTPFDSVGIASLSAGWPPSTGSIITPEPATICLLGLGSLALLRKKRRA